MCVCGDVKLRISDKVNLLLLLNMGDQNYAYTLFDNAPNIAGDVVDVKQLDYPPDNLDLSNRNMTFTIPPSNTMYTTDKVQLLLRIRVSTDTPADADGVAELAQAKYAFTNQIALSMWQGFSVSMNEVLVQVNGKPSRHCCTLYNLVVSRLCTTQLCDYPANNFGGTKKIFGTNHRLCKRYYRLF